MGAPVAGFSAFAFPAVAGTGRTDEQFYGERQTCASLNAVTISSAVTMAWA
ncbi:hypothetical protein [Nonomuraea sp. H19]|uniref:hypothetical protein n=1 Tax=Nonomuraea sp. H19 TaxID=3452206 RepID=UPI003F8B900E